MPRKILYVLNYRLALKHGCKAAEIDECCVDNFIILGYIFGSPGDGKQDS